MDMSSAAFKNVIAKSLGYTLVATFLNLWLYGKYTIRKALRRIHSRPDLTRAHFPKFSLPSKGFGLVQTYQYFLHCPHDRSSLKSLVLVVFVLGTLESTNLLVICWRYLISGYADPAFAQVSNWNLNAVPSVIGLLSFIVQLFFAFRVSLYSSRVILLLPILLAASASFLASIGTSIACGKIHYLADFSKARAVATTWLSTSALTDVLITIVLICSFKERRTGFSKDDLLITRMVGLALRTGFLTAVCSILALVLYLLPSEVVGTPYFLTAFSIGPLYVNSFLAVLLTRPKRMNLDKSPKFAVDTGADWSPKLVQAHIQQDLRSEVKPSVKESFALGLGGMLRPQANDVHINDSIIEQVELESNDVLPQQDRREFHEAHKRASEQTVEDEILKEQESGLRGKFQGGLDHERPGTGGSMSVRSAGRLSNADSVSKLLADPRGRMREIGHKSSVTTIASNEMIQSSRSVDW